jgi:hypothetical protein
MLKKPAKTIPRIVTRAAAAREKGVSRGAVTRACGSGGPLFHARSGRGVDLASDAARAWLADAPSSASDAQTDRFSALQLRRREAEVALIETRREREAGELIERQLVQTHVLGHLERLHLRLLRDVPASLAPRLAAAARTGAIDAALAATIRASISSELAAAKTAVVAGLRASRSSEAPQ